MSAPGAAPYQLSSSTEQALHLRRPPSRPSGVSRSHMVRIRAWMALACLLVGAPLSALDPARPLDLFFHQAWMTRDGLPQNSIEAILQTRDGYLWLATQEGPVRFAGVCSALCDPS